MEGSGTAALLVGVAVTTAVVAGVARRFGLPAPLVLVLVGSVGSLAPWVPEVRLEPSVVLVGVLPPLLYATAIRTSLVDFRANRHAISLLSVGAVLVTTAAVGLVVLALLPVPAAAAFALGAVVAPPDAVAATSIARRVGMPRRIVTVLEGESLVNDATALVCLRSALAALAGGITWWHVGWSFVLSAGGGVLVGLAVAWLLGLVRERITDPVLDTTTSLLAPYLAYLPAERIGASGVLAVVVTGLVLGHRAPLQQSAASRISERTNWRTVQFLLENAVFLLIGLQVVGVVRDAARSDVGDGRVVATCAAVLATTVLVRPVWVFISAHLSSRLLRLPDAPAWSALTVVSWAGMRGVVTLAAVLALPAATPQRAVLVLAGFVVAAGTLLGQGATLPWLVRRLPLPVPDPAQDALVQAQVLQQAHEAGLDRLEELVTPDVPEEVVHRLRDRSQRRADAVWERITPSGDTERPTVAYERLRLEMLGAERRLLLRLRDENDVPDEVLRRAQAVMDVEESLLDRIGAVDAGRERRRDGALLVAEGQPLCRHLAAAPGGADGLGDSDAYDTERPQGCEGCLAEGRSDWVTLRRCLTCGRVGCCDSSPRTHATRHFRSTRHPVMRSAEPGEAWRWCYVDRRTG